MIQTRSTTAMSIAILGMNHNGMSVKLAQLYLGLRAQTYYGGHSGLSFSLSWADFIINSNRVPRTKRTSSKRLSGT